MKPSAQEALDAAIATGEPTTLERLSRSTSAHRNVLAATVEQYIRYGLIERDEDGTIRPAAVDIAPERWWMHGHALVRDDGVRWPVVGDIRFVRMHGYPEDQITAVTVTADPDGDHLGWFDLPSDWNPDPRPEPGLIQPAMLFGIQFPYGVDAEIEHGKGYPVRLRIEPVEAT